MGRKKIEAVDPMVGDVWQGMAALNRERAVRKIKLTEVDETYAHGKDTQTKRKTRVLRSTMRPTARGWKLVERAGKKVEP